MPTQPYSRPVHSSNSVIEQEIAKQAKAAEEAEILAEKEADKLEVEKALASEFLCETAAGAHEVHRWKPDSLVLTRRESMASCGWRSFMKIFYRAYKGTTRIPIFFSWSAQLGIYWWRAVLCSRKAVLIERGDAIRAVVQDK